jgi:hypothetical protein
LQIMFLFLFFIFPYFKIVCLDVILSCCVCWTYTHTHTHTHTQTHKHTYKHKHKHKHTHKHTHKHIHKHTHTQTHTQTHTHTHTYIHRYNDDIISLFLLSERTFKHKDWEGASVPKYSPSYIIIYSWTYTWKNILS